MLFRIVELDSEDKNALFGEFVESIKKAYWPKQEFEKEEQYKNFLPKLDDLEKKTFEKQLEMTTQSLDKIADVVAKMKHYVIKKEDNKEIFVNMPYLERYYKYFLLRQWTKPYDNPIKNYHSLTRLKPYEKYASEADQKKDDNEDQNSSKNYGNYNHFINVTMAMARLIQFFQFKNFQTDYFKDYEESLHIEDLLFSKKQGHESLPNLRTFRLMLAAFFHDLGKTIVDHRHGMEGAVIFEDHTTKASTLFDKILSESSSNQLHFDRDDLFFVSNLIYFHDIFGTLSTGEDGYLSLIELIDQIKRYDQKGSPALQEPMQGNSCQECLFDLWLLNIADIMVSLSHKEKFIEQIEWLSYKTAMEKIQVFFKTPQFSRLKQDLYFALTLLPDHNKGKHTISDTYIQNEAYEYSEQHIVERIYRLIDSSCFFTINNEYVEVKKKINEINEELKNLNPSTKKFQIKHNELNSLSRYLEFLKYFNVNDIGYQSISGIIMRSIQSVSNFHEFCQRFSWIGKMDYALGFFREIVKTALKKVKEELDGGSTTGWIKKIVPNEQIEHKPNVEFFLDNYTAIVIQILNHLLCREQTINSHRNLEFEDAKKRLTEEKIELIISLEGPYRSKRSTQLILQTIFLY